MPHVIVKLWPGRAEPQKQALAEAITQAVTAHLGYGADAISVGFDEVAPADWERAVVGPEILGKWPSLRKRPGYVKGPVA